MMRTFLVAAVGAVAVVVPAAIGLAANPSLSSRVSTPPVQIRPVDDHRRLPTYPDPGDDDGGGTYPEPGDDGGGTYPEPGDDGGGRGTDGHRGRHGGRDDRSAHHGS
jgi:hypothetical protein